jgi:hypothetical protein
VEDGNHCNSFLKIVILVMKCEVKNCRPVGEWVHVPEARREEL